MNALSIEMFANHAEAFIHLTLRDDPAYQWSVANDDADNMRMVLRAYGKAFDFASAEKQIEVAKTFSK